MFCYIFVSDFLLLPKPVEGKTEGYMIFYFFTVLS